MPYARPSLTDLRAQVAQAIASALPGVDPLLPFSNVGILGQVLAGLTHLHYGYLDWIAQQATPYTATDEFLEAWAALKEVTRKPTTQATGRAAFGGANGTLLPAGSAVVRGDGQAYVTTSDGTVSSGSVTVPIVAIADPAGLVGAQGNCAAGTVLSLSQAVAGVSSAGTAAGAITGGADLETDDSLRTRMLVAYRTVAHGGSASDYLGWALAVAGVTRVWVGPHAYGAGTVVVWFMMDSAQAAHGGFPQGANGVALGETRDTVATGDQLAVANGLFPLQPVTALVFACAPTAYPIAITITGLSSASAATKAAVAASIAQRLLEVGTVSASGSTVALSDIDAAIAEVPGTTGFVVTVPAANVAVPAGNLPTLGTITWG